MCKLCAPHTQSRGQLSHFFPGGSRTVAWEPSPSVAGKEGEGRGQGRWERQREWEEGRGTPVVATSAPRWLPGRAGKRPVVFVTWRLCLMLGFSREWEQFPCPADLGSQPASEKWDSGGPHTAERPLSGVAALATEIGCAMSPTLISKTPSEKSTKCPSVLALISYRNDNLEIIQLQFLSPVSLGRRSCFEFFQDRVSRPICQGLAPE